MQDRIKERHLREGFCLENIETYIIDDEFQKGGHLNASAGIQIIEKLVMLMLESQQLTDGEVFDLLTGGKNPLRKAGGETTI
jgi:hypothetical protein